jgi:hypothetical protein
MDNCSTFSCWNALQEFPKLDRNPGNNVGEGPLKVFDSSVDTKWFVGKTSLWVQYELSASVEVKAYGIGTGNDQPTRDPKEWLLLGNNTGPDQNDSTDSEWTLVDSKLSPIAPAITDSLGQTVAHTAADRKFRYVFNVTTPGAFKFYRFISLSTNGATSTQFSELQLYTTAVAPGDPIPVNIAGFGTTSAYDPEGVQNLFDANPATKWLSFHAPSLWLQYQFATPPLDVTGYSLTTANDVAGRDPKKWQVLASDDATLPEDQWVVIDSQENQAFPARLTKYTYSVSCPTRGFKFYRLKIIENAGATCTASNGNVAACSQLAEFELLGHK